MILFVIWSLSTTGKDVVFGKPSKTIYNHCYKRAALLLAVKLLSQFVYIIIKYKLFSVKPLRYVVLCYFCVMFTSQPPKRYWQEAKNEDDTNTDKEKNGEAPKEVTDKKQRRTYRKFISGVCIFKAFWKVTISVKVLNGNLKVVLFSFSKHPINIFTYR